MSRRSHVVRSEDTGGLGQPRDLGGGCTILCATAPCADVADLMVIATIPTAATVTYQRVFLAATIATVTALDPDSNPSSLTAELYDDDAGVLGSITIANGTSGCLTAATDLPAGIWDISLRIYPTYFGGSGQFAGASMQVIIGQGVDTPGCIEMTP